MNTSPRTRGDRIADSFCVGLTALSISQVPTFIFNIANRPEMTDIPRFYSGAAGLAFAGLAVYLHERNHPANQPAED